MKVALQHGIHDLRIVEEPKPVPNSNECLVEVKAVSICGSDLHVYSEGSIGGESWSEPFSPGHEFAGICYGSKHIKDGTPVAVDPALPCEQCKMCRRGFQHLCGNIRFAGLPPIQGALREFFCWPEEALFSVPPPLSFAEAALLEPLSVAVHTLELVPPPVGGRVAILGSGGIGQVILQAVKAAGAAHVVMTDLIPERMALAKKNGADLTLDGKSPDLLGKIEEWSKAEWVDVVYEAAGAAETPGQALELVRPGGSVALVGIPSQDGITVSSAKGWKDEVRVTWIKRQNHNYPHAIALAEKGLVDLKSLITHSFPLDQASEAFTLAESKKDGALRVVIEL